jgi:hypothetical protein
MQVLRASFRVFAFLRTNRVSLASLFPKLRSRSAASAATRPAAMTQSRWHADEIQVALETPRRLPLLRRVRFEQCPIRAGRPELTASSTVRGENVRAERPRARAVLPKWRDQSFPTDTRPDYIQHSDSDSYGNSWEISLARRRWHGRCVPHLAHHSLPAIFGGRAPLLAQTFAGYKRLPELRLGQSCSLSSRTGG